MTKQVHKWFTGHTGYVSISWHICNNVDEMYVSTNPNHWGEMPALDGSLLYVWADVHLTDSTMNRRVKDDFNINFDLCDDLEVIVL